MYARLFAYLVWRPVLRDTVRAALAVIAVALGTAVVTAIDLAGTAAAGSFESSLASVVGKTSFEILANGGVDERLIGRLASLPLNARFAPVSEASIPLPNAGFVPVYGIDMVTEALLRPGSRPGASHCDGSEAVVSSRLARRLPSHFVIGSQPFCIASEVDASGGDFVTVDIADLQHALERYGTVDRVDVFLSPGESSDVVERELRAALPAGYQITRPGTQSRENQRMLAAFRWNLRILSYIGLLVGAFLIYNTVSISVVRRRSEIGILRALGTSRRAILLIFLAEAAAIGVIGALIGVALGRILAAALVGMISSTVQSLYTSSSPAPLRLQPLWLLWSVFLGLVVAVASAWFPAFEALRIAPVEAMGRGARETRFRGNVRRNILWAIVSAAVAFFASKAGPVGGAPVFGYLASLLSVAAAAALTPWLVVQCDRLLRPSLRKLFGAEGMIGGRGLALALGRTSVVVAALATAVAMVASVGTMIASFRQTVLLWVDGQLRADLYVSAAGPSSAGSYPAISPEIPRLLRGVEGVADIDVFSGLELHYQGQRATLGAGDADVVRRHGRIMFVSGNRDAILRTLPGGDRAIVSEPFAEKHHLRTGDRLLLPLGSHQVSLQVAGIYYDYSSEAGYVILDRSTLLKYLPGQPPTSIALYARPGVDRDRFRGAVERRLAAFPVTVAANWEIRREAMAIFDRTFSITWTLELIALIVAVLGAANALLAMVIDRRREIGMLRYLGAASRQIRRMILLEAGLLGFLALLIGAALGIVLSGLLIFVINKQSFGWTIQFHPPGLLLAAAMILIWVMTLLAGLYPARMAAALNPIEVIHEE